MMYSKKLVLSAATLVFAGSLIASGTGAFFSDEERSEGNTFTAGAIDLTVDSEAHYNKHVCINDVWQVEEGAQPPIPAYPVAGTPCTTTWGQPTGKDIVAERFFDYGDLKPGDEGENTISLHVANNEAWMCVNVIPTKNDDVSSNEPELESGDSANTDSIFDGELAQQMEFMIWADTCSDTGLQAVPGDNVYQEGCDRLLTSGPGPIVPTAYPVVTPAGNAFTGDTSPFLPGQTQYLGVGWRVPTSVGNTIQTDTYQADIAFVVEQSRNNPTFTCPNVTPQSNVLRLENEVVNPNGPWTVLSGDQVYADLTWNPSGPTFDYTLAAYGLDPSTTYSLIYYADGWPGNHPGAFIGSFTTDPSGNIATTTPLGGAELNMDLPHPDDGNYAVGAKIWLVLASDYNTGTKSMTAWNPSKYLFEGNVYIHYDNTQVP